MSELENVIENQDEVEVKDPVEIPKVNAYEAKARQKGWLSADDIVYIFTGGVDYSICLIINQSIGMEPSTSTYWQVFKNYNNRSYMSGLFNKMIEGMK